jgi:hypothetical protein
VSVVVTADVLFPGFGSAVVVLTFAVLLIVPLAEALTFTTTVKVAVAPARSEPIVQLIVPVPPTGGLVQTNTGPAVCVSETNVAFTGTASVSETVCASDGPLFVIAIVNVAF